jgi:small subunit ribosomal protein S7
MELKKIVNDALRFPHLTQAKNDPRSEAVKGSSHGPQRRDAAALSDNGGAVIHKFIKILMKDGKKYIAIEILEHSIQHLGIPAILTAIENVKPFLEVRPIRIAGTTYQVPYEVKGARQLYLAIKWLILGAKSRNEKTMGQKLLAELTAAVKKQGFAIKKKEEFHKLAEANRAFSNFRWMP